MSRTPIYYLENIWKATQRWEEMKKKYPKQEYKKQIGLYQVIRTIRYKPKTRFVVAHTKRAEVNLNLKDVKRLR